MNIIIYYSNNYCCISVQSCFDNSKVFFVMHKVIVKEYFESKE